MRNSMGKAKKKAMDPTVRALDVRRYALGVTFAELSKQTGYSRYYLSVILSGRGKSAPVCEAVSAYLDTVEAEQVELAEAEDNGAV